MRRALFVVIAATTFSSACSGKSTTSPTTTPPPALTVTAVTISGTAPAIGQTSQLTATATMSNGTTQDVTAQSAWQSSNTSVVIVSSSGAATGVAAGEADVRAAFSGVNGSLHIKLQARTFAVAGVITDSESGRSIDGEVEIVDGANAGKVTRADSTGRYSLSGLVAGSFALRARATGYDSSDMRVTIVDSDARADITLRRTPGPPDYSGVWTGEYKITDCANIDPPGATPINICGYPASSNAYRFTLSQNSRTVTGTYRMVSAMFSCPCGGEYGTFDVSGTIAADGTLTMTTTGTPRGSGVVLTETFKLTLTSASTLGGSVTGTLGLGTTVRGTFNGSVLSGTR
jgi:Carboxypeptidase regulatory-like domain/Bacterial Ig-like domain (group 2)